MATAALDAMRRRFAAAHIVHLMRPYVADVLDGTELCNDRIFWPTGTGRHKESTWRFIRRIRDGAFDAAVLLTNSFRSALAARLAGIPRRVGYARDGRGWLLTDRLSPPKLNGRFTPIPALDYYNDVARHLGCDRVGDRLVLATTPGDESAVDDRLGDIEADRPLVVLNPGANFGSAKCWPAEKYAAVADRLHDACRARVVASLAPRERPIADRLIASARRPIEVFVDPPLGLGPLKALVRRCRLLITNDTGPRHFAAAFGVPVITIFGSSDPAWTDTRFRLERAVKLDLDCQPCMKRTCPLGHHDCMNRLHPDLVATEAERILAAESDACPAAGCESPASENRLQCG